ncbi:DUF2752 domain-containing protein [Proteiniclasticum sp. BAD-10]|uniref:DUF2752 domain-containing protein n=1 Tax=Proteiniclasticum sediminis TaxID=2804028 RepID=A0A941HRB9_9CLOT|nr:DUF2752 domain-containing protein [Proteiniclasticum sediminis]MBR0576835.1 DUF2752 domain-containing protein [Proteiniclasticum sediminis]
MEKERRKGLGILILLGGFSLLFVYYVQGSLCIFYQLFGIPCPSCGMTRAFLHFLQGDLQEAFRFHPLFPLVPLLLLSYLKNWQKLLVGIGILFIALWVLRLALYFPHTEPMNYNHQSLAALIIQWIKE